MVRATISGSRTIGRTKSSVVPGPPIEGGPVQTAPESLGSRLPSTSAPSRRLGSQGETGEGARAGPRAGGEKGQGTLQRMASDLNLRGVYVAAVTPFEAGGEVARGALEG